MSVQGQPYLVRVERECEHCHGDGGDGSDLTVAPCGTCEGTDPVVSVVAVEGLEAAREMAKGVVQKCRPVVLAGGRVASHAEQHAWQAAFMDAVALPADDGSVVLPSGETVHVEKTTWAELLEGGGFLVADEHGGPGYPRDYVSADDAEAQRVLAAFNEAMVEKYGQEGQS